MLGGGKSQVYSQATVFHHHNHHQEEKEEEDKEEEQEAGGKSKDFQNKFHLSVKLEIMSLKMTNKVSSEDKVTKVFYMRTGFIQDSPFLRFVIP